MRTDTDLLFRIFSSVRVGLEVKRVRFMEADMKKAGIGFFLLMSAALLGAQTAVIRETTGTVEIKAPGASAWKAAAVGQTLDKAALVSTGFKSTALVQIGNSSIIVRPLTRLSLEEIAANQNEEQVILNLQAGRVRADIKPPAGGGKINFAIRSPSVTASVRGTVFDFDGTRLKVAEGRVHLGGKTVMGAYIGAGHSTAVDTERGKAATALEGVKEELAPPLPTGVDTAPDPIGAAGAYGNLDIGFDWPERE
jgi:hypothetical protein